VYAARAGRSLDESLEDQGPLVTLEIAGTALVELMRADAASLGPVYVLNGAGLQKLP
jgi:3-oxoacyl-[acyl-carrier protein] reductase